MNDALDRFRGNITRARDLRELVVVLAPQVGPAVDLSDVLRACIVSGVSAFDTLIHDQARIGMVECLQGTRTRTDAFGRFAVQMDGAILWNANPASVQWLEVEVRRQHGWLAFQQPDKVADAIRLISGKDLWKEVGVLLGIEAKSAKTRLALIVDRRNKIAHEADMDPGSPGDRWPIDEGLVADALDTLLQIGEAVHTVVTTP